MGILVLLAGILFPVFRAARRQGMERRCITVLHEMHEAYSLAVIDDPQWDLQSVPFTEVKPYVGRQDAWVCPLVSSTDPGYPWGGMGRIAVADRPLEPDAPFLLDNAHHILYNGPWLVVTAAGAGRPVISDCRPISYRSVTGEFLDCKDLKDSPIIPP